MASDYDATSMRIPERSPSRQQPPGTTSTMGPGPNSLEIDRYNANGIRTPDNAHLKGALSNGPLPPPGSPGSRNRSRPPSQAYPPTAQDQLLHSQQQDPDDSSLMSGPPPPRGSADRQRAGNKPARSPSGQARICKKCNQVLTGQFVRALDGTFHLDCFRCRDCGQIVASKLSPPVCP